MNPAGRQGGEFVAANSSGFIALIERRQANGKLHSLGPQF
jgi:hypothetical protein